MHPQYREDENSMKKIVMENVTPTEDSKRINLVIYYKNRRTRDLVMKNNPSPPAREPLKQKNVVYQFVCPVRGCPGAYIGMTTMRLSKRISCHAQEGAIMNHARATHNISISRDSIIQNISIIGRAADPRRLRLLEALLIAERKPTMNTTQEASLLPTNLRRIMQNTHQIQRIPENDNPENGDAPDERGALRDNPPTTTERVDNDIIHPQPNSSQTTDDVSRHDITQRQANGNAGMNDIPRLRRSVRIELRRRNLA